MATKMLTMANKSSFPRLRLVHEKRRVAVDLTFLARQERESNNSKSSETIKVFKMQFILALLIM